MAAQIKPLRVRKLADKSVGTREVRFLARNVQLDENGNALIDPTSVERILFNPATPELEHEPWPLAGVCVVDEQGRPADPPKHTRVAESWVAQGKQEGWLELEGEEPVHRPGGPESDPWRRTHTFLHGTALVIHCQDGDVRYKITQNPDKQHANREGDPGEVWHHYDLELEA